MVDAWAPGRSESPRAEADVREVVRNSNRPEIGEFLGSEYRVTRVLSEGLQSVLFEAVNVRLGQRVAIKVPQPVVLEQPVLVERFAREALAAVRLRSRNSVRVIDVGAAGSGAPIMVMELLEGRDLEAEIAERGALPIHEAVQYVLQTCSALVEAHSQGIVHRDLKPSKLFLAREPDGERCIKVLGLGASPVQGSVQKAGLPVAELRYTSPEVLLGSKAVDPRSDVWSLGAILYELLAGTPPFASATSAALETAILDELPEPLHVLRADIPAEVEALVFKAMDKESHHRFASAREFMIALTPFGTPLSPLERPAVREPFERVDTIERTSSTSQAPPAGASGFAGSARPRWRTLAVLTPFVVAVSALYITQCNRPRERTQTSSEPSVREPKVNSNTLELSRGVLSAPPAPSAEVGATTPVRDGDGASADAPTAGDVARAGDVATTEAREEGRSNAPEASSAAQQKNSPLEPLRAETSAPPRRGAASYTRTARASLEAAPARPARPSAKATSVTKPAATPTVRDWDEDSPVPP